MYKLSVGELTKARASDGFRRYPTSGRRRCSTSTATLRLARPESRACSNIGRRSLEGLSDPTPGQLKVPRTAPTSSQSSPRRTRSFCRACSCSAERIWWTMPLRNTRNFEDSSTRTRFARSFLSRPPSLIRLFRKERCDDLLLNVVAARTSPGSPLRVALPEKSISDYGLSCS